MAEVKMVSGSDGNVLADVFESRMKSRSPKTLAVSPRVMVDLLCKGVQGDVLKRVVEHIPKVVVYGAVGTDSTNFSKMVRRERLTGRVTEELNDLTRLWAELRQFFNWDDELVKEWIEQKLPALDGAAPIELMSSQAGREIVKQQLDAMRFGDCA